MKTLLVAINSKYIHTSLAIRDLKVYSEKNGNEVNIKEYTINSLLDSTVEDLYKENADIYGFSTYIFNLERILDIVRDLKKILPNAIIFLGGPEVSYEYEPLLRSNKEIDFIIKGEGEKTVNEFLAELKKCDKLSNIKPFMYNAKIKNLCFLYNDLLIEGENRSPICNLEDVPFSYTDYDLELFKNKILYYESSRGCPFGCTYCMSSLEKKVRAMSLPRVFEDLAKFIKHNVKQVKFVDRTFNYDKNRAIEILKYLIDNDNGKTNFHFEISAWLVDDDVINILKNARKGLFQFEIGIQSTNIQSLQAINRNVSFEKISCVVKKLIKTNVSIHVDLIAGLPYETFDIFKSSFNDVMKLGADCVQLGFLKILKGTHISTEWEYGYVYSSKPPYEILYNKYITYSELCELKHIEALVDLYYNSKICTHCLCVFCERYYKGDWFTMLFDYSKYLMKKDFFEVAHKTSDLYDLLYNYIVTLNVQDQEFIENMIAYDLFDNGMVYNEPIWFTSVKIDREKIREICRNPSSLCQLFDNNILNQSITPISEKWSRKIQVVKYMYSYNGEKQDNYMLYFYGDTFIKTSI